jgi:hypothetical protein
MSQIPFARWSGTVRHGSDETGGWRTVPGGDPALRSSVTHRDRAAESLAHPAGQLVASVDSARVAHDERTIAVVSALGDPDAVQGVRDRLHSRSQ